MGFRTIPIAVIAHLPLTSESGIYPVQVENVEPLFHPPTSGLSKDHATDSDPNLVANQPMAHARAANLINWRCWFNKAKFSIQINSAPLP
ncbi:hypothetical protein PCASD_06550 [Puccinia coronata f. sp. avenae]|uniref:Uncharacterized protein n=1 Tax=Puccinia coronata f. sp. avenae TaxID=200324 RepID=A0A2N5TFP2_9BASI|nr:hypothetical protein PCASD_06550 [Puccinia coronata f. sp. avenae]